MAILLADFLNPQNIPFIDLTRPMTDYKIWTYALRFHKQARIVASLAIGD